MAQIDVYDIKGQKKEGIEVPEDIFGPKVNTDVIHQAVVMYQACQRQGTHDTKMRGEVSGGNKKPFKQKGTGRARQGSTRSPLWTKGGVVWGPHPREYRYSVPQKIRLAALRESLNAKNIAGNLSCIADFNAMQKTKEFAQVLKALGLTGKILVIIDKTEANIELAARNIRSLTVVRPQDVNAHDVLLHKKILVTRPALNKILDRVKK
ncbi:MAG: 50S ribosomal protein L4 [Candidatus Omnitrophica bacterium]|nr:50S ribosomal protein L4 [Candidatus Omnitrophota bacterium]